MSLLPKEYETRFKNSESEYKRLRAKVDKGTANASEQLAYIDAKESFFSECEKILSELLSKDEEA